MHTEATTIALTCPLCGSSPCDVLKVVPPKPDSVLALDLHDDATTIHARCPQCAAEFQITKVTA